MAEPRRRRLRGRAAVGLPRGLAASRATPDEQLLAEIAAVRARRRARPPGAVGVGAEAAPAAAPARRRRARRGAAAHARRDRRRAAGEGGRVRRRRGDRAARAAEPARARAEARQGARRASAAALAAGEFEELDGGRFRVAGHELEPDEVLVERIGQRGLGGRVRERRHRRARHGARRRAATRGPRPRPDPRAEPAAQGRGARAHRPDRRHAPAGDADLLATPTGSRARRSPSRSRRPATGASRRSRRSEAGRGSRATPGAPFPPSRTDPSYAGGSIGLVQGETKVGLGILGSGLVLGVAGDVLLRATPYGVNVLLWTVALLAALFALARWRRPLLRRRAAVHARPAARLGAALLLARLVGARAPERRRARRVRGPVRGERARLPPALGGAERGRARVGRLRPLASPRARRRPRPRTSAWSELRLRSHARPLGAALRGARARRRRCCCCSASCSSARTRSSASSSAPSVPDVADPLAARRSRSSASAGSPREPCARCCAGRRKARRGGRARCAASGRGGRGRARAAGRPLPGLRRGAAADVLRRRRVRAGRARAHVRRVRARGLLPARRRDRARGAAAARGGVGRARARPCAPSAAPARSRSSSSRCCSSSSRPPCSGSASTSASSGSRSPRVLATAAVLWLAVVLAWLAATVLARPAGALRGRRARDGVRRRCSR